MRLTFVAISVLTLSACAHDDMASGPSASSQTSSSVRSSATRAEPSTSPSSSSQPGGARPGSSDAAQPNNPNSSTSSEAPQGGSQAAGLSSSQSGGSPALPSLTAEAYVSNAAMGDMFEIQASQLALKKAQSAGVKSFAQMMVDGHTATSAKLKPIAQQANLSPPAKLDAKRQALIAALEAASAPDFNTRYLEQQIAAHEEALALHEAYAARGDNAALRAFAAQTVPVVQQHLMQVRALQK